MASTLTCPQTILIDAINVDRQNGGASTISKATRAAPEARRRRKNAGVYRFDGPPPPTSGLRHSTHRSRGSGSACSWAAASRPESDSCRATVPPRTDALLAAVTGTFVLWHRPRRVLASLGIIRSTFPPLARRLRRNDDGLPLSGSFRHPTGGSTGTCCRKSLPDQELLFVAIDVRDSPPSAEDRLSFSVWSPGVLAAVDRITPEC